MHATSLSLTVHCYPNELPDVTLRRQFGARVHFWPFDGWVIPPRRSAVAEVYPSLWRHAYAQEERTPDQHDAYTVATRLREADRDGRLAAALSPALTPLQRAVAQVEGWILGVG